MSDGAPKSAFELAMERLRKKDADEGVVEKSLTDEQKLKTLSAMLLLAPSPPLIFMGEEWGCHQPFLFFCDFEGELGDSFILVGQPGFKEATPYVVVLVELDEQRGQPTPDEGLRIIANLVKADGSFALIYRRWLPGQEPPAEH